MNLLDNVEKDVGDNVKLKYLNSQFKFSFNLSFIHSYYY